MGQVLHDSATKTKVMILRRAMVVASNSHLPGIDQRHAAPLEAAGVAGSDERGAGGARDGRNLAVGGGDGPPSGPPLRCDRTKGGGAARSNGITRPPRPSPSRRATA